MASNEAKTGPGIAISLIVLLGGFVLAGVGFALAFRHLAATETSSPYPVPGVIEQSLDDGTYDIFVESVEIFDAFDAEADFANASDLDVIVRAPSGQELTLGFADPSLVTNRGFTFYEHVGSFDVVEDGTYVLEVESDEATTVVVAESIETAWREAVPWGIASVVGSILTLVGLIMLVAGIVRRQRATTSTKAQHYQQTPAPPGQFPVPGAPALPTSPPPPPSTPNEQPPNF